MLNLSYGIKIRDQRLIKINKKYSNFEFRVLVIVYRKIHDSLLYSCLHIILLYKVIRKKRKDDI